MSCHRAQRGFTLIELMVGLTIGLLVVLAGIGSLVFTQATSAVVDDGARLQQKTDAIFRNIGYHIVQAGAIETASTMADPALVTFSTLYQGYDATYPYNIHGEEGASNAADTLRVSYENIVVPVTVPATPRSRNCLGNGATTANVNNKFYKSTTSDDLMCLGAAAVAAQSVADGVKDFQVWYGVRTGIVPGTEGYQFFTATNVSDWTRVTAVRICLHVVGDGKSNINPTLLDCQGASTTTTDGLLHRVFWHTYTLRNALL